MSVWISSSRPIQLVFLCWKHIEGIKLIYSWPNIISEWRLVVASFSMSSENGKWPSWINSDGFEYQKCAGITFSHSFWVFTWILWLWYRLRAETQRGKLMSANYDWWYEPRCASWLHVISNHMSIFIRLRSPQLAPLLLLGNLLLKTPTGVCLSVCHLTNVTLWIIMWK